MSLLRSIRRNSSENRIKGHKRHYGVTALRCKTENGEQVAATAHRSPLTTHRSELMAKRIKKWSKNACSINKNGLNLLVC
jgi:hypothetical protein